MLTNKKSTISITYMLMMLCSSLFISSCTSVHSAVQSITSSHDFQNKVLTRSKTNPVIVDFSATWCGPCKKMKPIFEKLSQELTEYAFFVVDVDKASSLASQYGVRGVPTFLFFKDGKKIGSMSGSTSESSFRNKIKSIFGSNNNNNNQNNNNN